MTSTTSEVQVLEWPAFEKHRDDLVVVAQKAAEGSRPRGLTVGMRERERWETNDGIEAARRYMRGVMVKHLGIPRSMRVWRLWANHLDPTDRYGKGNTEYAVGFHRHKSVATGILHVSGDGAFLTREKEYPFRPGQVLLFELDLEHAIEIPSGERVSYALDAMR